MSNCRHFLDSKTTASLSSSAYPTDYLVVRPLFSLKLAPHEYVERDLRLM